MWYIFVDCRRCALTISLCSTFIVSDCKQDSVAMARHGRQHWLPTSNTSKCIADSRCQQFFRKKDLSKIWLFWLHHNLNCMKAHDTGNFNDQVLIMSATSEWTCAPPWPVNVRSHHGLPLQRLTWLLHCWETNSVRKQAVNVTHADCSWLWWFSVTLNAPSPIQLKPNWSCLGKVHPTAIFKTCTCLIDTWLLCQI